MTEPLLLTEEQAAARLLMHPRTLRKLRQEGAIRYVGLVGRRVAYRNEDLDEFIASRLKMEPVIAPARHGKRTVGRRASGNIVPFSARQGNRGVGL